MPRHQPIQHLTINLFLIQIPTNFLAITLSKHLPILLTQHTMPNFQLNIPLLIHQPFHTICILILSTFWRLILQHLIQILQTLCLKMLAKTLHELLVQIFLHKFSSTLRFNNLRSPILVLHQMTNCLLPILCPIQHKLLRRPKM